MISSLPPHHRPGGPAGAAVLVVPHSLHTTSSLHPLQGVVGGKVLTQLPHRAQHLATPAAPVVPPLSRSALALVAGAHVVAEEREGGEILGAVPAAHREPLHAGVHLLLRHRVLRVRYPVLVVDLQHLRRSLGGSRRSFSGSFRFFHSSLHVLLRSLIPTKTLNCLGGRGGEGGAWGGGA